MSLWHVFQFLFTSKAAIRKLLHNLLQGVNRPGRGAGHSYPFREAVKNGWSYTIALYVRCLHCVIVS